MNQIKTLITIMVLVLISCGLAVSQSRSRKKTKTVRPALATSSTPTPTPTPTNTKQPVSIKLKNGDLIIARLLHRDNQTIQVDLAEGPRTIRLSEIQALTYLEEKPADEKSSKDKSSTTASEETAANQPAAASEQIMANGRRAYAALRKLAVAAQIGSPYPQFSYLLIETKAAVDESLSTIPENAIKAELAAAMEAYLDAGQALAAAQTVAMPPGQVVVVLSIGSDPGAMLMKKYGIKPAVNALGQEDRLMLDATLSAIWAVANTHLANAGPMLKM